MSFNKQVPAYSGDGVAIWKGIVENGNNKGDEYLKVKILGHVVNCFQVKEVEEKGD